jgi:hypothetical protein
MIRMEIGIWRSLGLLVARRTHGTGPGAQPFPYARQLTPVLGAFVFVSLVELPVVHLLLPWATVRLVVLVVSVWGLLWMLGLLASMKVFPHVIDHAGIRARYGFDVDIRVPWSAIETVTTRRGSVGGSGRVRLDGTSASIPVLNQTRVAVALRAPTMLELPDGPAAVSELRLYADDASAFVAAARERLAGRA